MLDLDAIFDPDNDLAPGSVDRVFEFSDDQKMALQAIEDWRRRRSPQVLTLGGYAGCLSGDTQVLYNRGDLRNQRCISLQELYLKFDDQRDSGRGAAQVWDPESVTYLQSLWSEKAIRPQKSPDPRVFP